MPTSFSNRQGFVYIHKSPCDDGFGNLIHNSSGYDLIAIYWMETDLEYYWLTGTDLLATL